MAQKKYLDSAGLSKFFENIANTFSKKNHTHTKSQITDFPASLKNPMALTISLNGTSQGAYDGSASKSINITASSVGAAAASHSHSYLPLSGGTMTGVIKRQAGGSNIFARDNVLVNNTNTAAAGNAWSGFGGQKTTNGHWAVGNLSGSENLSFHYTSDSDYNNGTNSSIDVNLPNQTGTIITSATIGAQSVNYANTAGTAKASDVYAWAKASTKPSYSASEVGAVPTSRTVNGKALSANITLSASDVGAAASSHSHNYAGSSSAGGNANWANGSTYANYSYNDKPITTAGTGAAYTASVSGLTLVAGASFVMVPHVVSTTATPTLNVNGLGAKNIRMRISSSTVATTALPSVSFLAANKPVRMMYDGSQWVIDDMVRPDANNLYGTIISRGTAAPTSSTEGYIYIQTT